MIRFLLSLATSPTIAIPILLLVAFYYFFIRASVLPDLPIIGAREGDWFPLLQARFRNSLDFKAALKSSYAQYRHQAAILPLVGGGSAILLPRSDTKFASEQPSDVLSMHDQAQANLQTDYTTMQPWLIHDPIHVDLVVGVLTKEIGNLLPDLVDEVEFCLDKVWGNDNELKAVCVSKSMQQIISGVTNRAFVGLPFCRHEEMLKMGVAFAEDVPLSSLLINLLPTFARPFLAPLITLPNRLHTRKFVNILGPEVKVRLEEYDAQDGEATDKPAKSKRNDFLQWSITQAKNIGNPKNWQIEALAQRILLLNFAAIHTSTFALTHALLDLASSSPEIIDELRAEIQSVLLAHDNKWNKRALVQMEKLDSAIRESQRKNSIVNIGINRAVVAKTGVTFPSGTHVPRGLTVAVPGYSIHQDSEVYPNPKTYQPFRFYNARKNEDDHVKSARNAFPTATEEFLNWGLGKSACPGRFFASNEIKMILAYILLHYEIDHLANRPRNVWIAQNRVPPLDAQIKIRRRVNV